MNSNAAVQQQQEILAELTATFPRFCGILEILPKDKSQGRMKFRLNSIQKLFEIHRTGRDIVLKPRQIGFSTLELARDVYYMLTKKGSRVVIICQSKSDNAPIKNLSQIINRYFESVKKIGIRVQFDAKTENAWRVGDSILEIHAAGASEASADKIGRGSAIDRVHVTEMAFFEFPEKTWNAVDACLHEKAEVVIESTPNGMEGLFYKMCKASREKKSGYKFHFYPWFLHSEYTLPIAANDTLSPPETHQQRIREDGLRKKGCTDGQILWLRRKIENVTNPGYVDQEFPTDPTTCFLLTGRTFFNAEVTQGLFDLSEPPIEVYDQDRIRIFKRSEPSEQYVLALDPSEGTGGDPTGGMMYNRRTGEHVVTILGQYTPAELVDACARTSIRPGKPIGLAYLYNTAQIAVERNNHGHSVIGNLQRPPLPEDPTEQPYPPYPNVYFHDDEKPGWPTGQITRAPMLDALADAHKKGHWKTKDQEVLAQLRTFVVIRKKGQPRAEAAHGEFDDLVLAGGIGWAVRERHKLIDLGVGGTTSGRGGSSEIRPVSPPR